VYGRSKFNEKNKTNLLQPLLICRVYKHSPGGLMRTPPRVSLTTYTVTVCGCVSEEYWDNRTMSVYDKIAIISENYKIHVHVCSL